MNASAETSVEKTLEAMLAKTRPAELFDAMRYAVMPGGKRLRPKLCLAAAAAVGGDPNDAVYPACAIELLHSYTLVHDDLPAMDDDAVRRGRPSVWAKFGETNAILAGDALQALAFKAAANTPRNPGKVVAALGEAGVGVVRGQVADLAGGDIDFICRHKTADLFVAAVTMGALAAGASDSDIGKLRDYAIAVGVAFQHADDLLDGESPFPPDAAQRKIADLADSAKAALDGLPGDTAFLAAFADLLKQNTNQKP